MRVLVRACARACACACVSRCVFCFVIMDYKIQFNNNIILDARYILSNNQNASAIDEINYVLFLSPDQYEMYC